MKPFPIIVKKNFNKPYIGNGRFHFLVYSLDGSITGKEAGFKVPPVIFFDKLKFLIKEKKSEDLHKYIKKAKIDLTETTHYYEIGNKKITINYFVPDDFQGFYITINSNKEIKLLLDVNFSFDYIYHENPIKKFSLKEEDGKIFATSTFDPKLTCMFKSNKNLKLYKNLIKVRGKKIKLFITGSMKSRPNLFRHMKELVLDAKNRKYKRRKTHNRIFSQSKLKTNIPELDKTFLYAKYNLRLLRHQQPSMGRSYLAGQSHFPEFYSRDTFISFPGILMTGDFNCAKTSLNIFARYQSKVETETKNIGEIPHEIWLTGEPNYYGIDSTSLFLYALYNYYKWTADKEYINNLTLNIKDAINSNLQFSKNFMIEHKTEGFLRGTTWMDSYHRSKNSVEIQGLFARTLEYASKLTSDRKLKKEYLSMAKKAKAKLNKFWKKDYFIDHINPNNKPSKSITINPMFLLLLTLVEQKKANKIIKKIMEYGFLTKYGIRTRSKKSIGYDPKHYHKGSVWPFITSLTSLAFFKYNKSEKAFEILKTMFPLYEKFSPGFCPEVLHGSKPTMELKHKSCFLQLWSSACFIQAVIEGMLGITPIPPNKLKIKPKLPKEINKVELKNLRVFSSIVDIKITKKKKTIIKCNIKKGSLKIIK